VNSRCLRGVGAPPAAGKQPWSFLERSDRWFRDALATKALELGYWA
jgi:hypothetical protein